MSLKSVKMLFDMNGSAGHNLSASVNGEASTSCLRQCNGAQHELPVQFLVSNSGLAYGKDTMVAKVAPVEIHSSHFGAELWLYSSWNIHS